MMIQHEDENCHVFSFSTVISSVFLIPCFQLEELLLLHTDISQR